ncbi:MAG: DoxX family membrane protein [Bacteroidetes bacterium]|nr:DoxX family membrane protein [Bacteroidota bacterium]
MTTPQIRRDAAIAVLRILLGVLFLYASLGKITDPTAFASSVTAYDIVGGHAALFLATVLPWVEALCGVGLILGLFWRGSAFLTILMLAQFTAVVLYALWRGLDISCGCYTQDPAAERLGWWKIGENAILLVVATLVLRHPRAILALDRVLRRSL